MKTPCTAGSRWRLLAVGALLMGAVSACFLADGRQDPAAHPRDPVARPVHVCGNVSILGGGPAKAPEGAVVVPAGDNSSVDFMRAGKTFWFAPGTHTLGNGEYSQIGTGDHSRYVGAPGAVLDGRHRNQYAISGQAKGVVVEYLTIRNFGAVGSNTNEAVVNHDYGEDWTIRYNTIEANAGAGMMLGSGTVARYNCVTRNEQYGFIAYSPRGPVGVTLDHNELSYNNTYDWESRIEGCGCTGGGKFWAVTGARVTGNYVHDNFGPGLWADNNDRGFLFEDNYISDNEAEGIVYETSYNAVIRDNAFVRNGLAAGPKNPSFPTGAVYISESGADRRVGTRYGRALEITGNLFEDNWSGVVLWENADRYCGSPANTSTGECTLVNPGVVTDHTCSRANIAKQPYYGDCRWKTQNVKVHGNTFRSDPARIGPKCTFARSCGLNAVFSNFGAYPDWTPYYGQVVEKAVTYGQHNSFYDNTYQGAWRFMAFEQGRLVTFAEWRVAPYSQDARSTLTATSPSASGSPGRG